MRKLPFQPTLGYFPPGCGTAEDVECVLDATGPWKSFHPKPEGAAVYATVLRQVL